MERHERYQLDGSCSSSSLVISAQSRAPPLYRGAANLVGIDDSRIKLIKMLALETDQQLKVVSVVGSAGVGKTTLAKEVFQELGGQFEFRAFVRASRKPEIRRILGGILSQVRPRHQAPSNAGPVQNLTDNLKEHLQDKRYFIVIDDLWGKTAWDIVCAAFPQGDNCSRIITTTQDVNVALGCCGYRSNNMLKMKPLGIHECRQLFFSQVFGSELQCPTELKEISYDIIRKCCGLPLAIINLAGILACQLHYLELWNHVSDCLCSILNRSYTVEEIQIEILNLSYNSLPHCLKTCLLYFTMYPEGYIIWKVDLVKQWIAEGFINATQGKETEEIAESYFDELINRGMIEPSKIDDNDEVLSCTVHHIVLDLVTNKAKEDKFISTIDYSQTTTGLSTKAHRLSLSFSSAKYAKQLAGITSQLRSLAFFGLLKCMPSIVEYKLLRVLILQFWGDHGVCTSLDLSRIFRLCQLRYLKVSSDIMVELPSQMRGLQYLETLEIDARICAVPLDIVHLPSLLHLSLRDATILPDGIGLIRSLTTLQYFDLGHNSEENVWSLGGLMKLRHLHLTCSVLLSNEHLKRKLIPLVSSLGKFGNLKSLTLTPGALQTAIFIDISSSIPSPPSVFLQRLELLPPICFFSRLPNRMGQLRELRILKIVISELRGNDINNLAGLPSLMVLSLYVQTAPDGTIIFTNMAFSALKYFKFRCSVMWLTFQAGAMPNVQRIKLCFNAHKGENYGRLLNGIEHLSNLQEISVRIGAAAGGNESDRRATESSFEDIIRKHPRCSRFNIQWVGLVEEEYPPSEKQHRRQPEGSSGEPDIVEKDSTEDTNKHAGSRLSGVFVLPSASPSGHLKSDEAIEHHMLASILRDETAGPANLDLSLFKDITNNFSSEQEIGRGGLGVVYKGKLRDGIVAVKRLYGPQATVNEQFLRIVKGLMTVKHSNIVRFLGYYANTEPKVTEERVEMFYAEQPERLLCFEYLHNGSLQRHITDESCGLEWLTRYQIIKGICQGLDYLHEKGIIHLDLKPENILLDANMVPKIADYGYAKLLGEDRDYMAPEGVNSFKSDIYSLGVIIMLIVTGHKDHPNIPSVLGGWRSRLESDKSRRDMAFETAYHQVKLCLEIGINCMHCDPGKRPVTWDITHRLDETGQTEQSAGSSVSHVSKSTEFGTHSMFPSKTLFQQSNEEAKASPAPSPMLGIDYSNHDLEKKVVFEMHLQSDKEWTKAFKNVGARSGVSSISRQGNKLTVVGSPLDPVDLIMGLRKVGCAATIVSVDEAKPTGKEKKLAAAAPETEKHLTGPLNPSWYSHSYPGYPIPVHSLEDPNSGCSIM